MPMTDQPSATLQVASACQSTGVGIGRHCHMTTANTTLAISTYRLRSISFGTTRVHIRLNPGRAITECCRPKSSIRPISTTTANPSEPMSRPRSMELGISVRITG